MIDDEVRQLLDQAHTRVTETLTATRRALDSLARLLLGKEAVDRATLERILEGTAGQRVAAG